MGTWNIRSTNDKEMELAQEFNKVKLDTLGVTETKKKEKGEMELEGQLYYSTVEWKQKRQQKLEWDA